MNNRQRGLTLIELLAVMAIVAILGSMAVAAYSASVQKSHRTDAKTGLTSAAQAMERWFTERNTYAGAVLGAGGIYAATTSNGYYNLSFVVGGTTNANAIGYTLRATPVGAQANDACGVYTLDQTNNITAKGVSPPPTGCW